MSVVWYRDPSAAGLRSRAFPVNGGELAVYDTGEWYVCIPGRYQVAATGDEPTIDAGKARAVLVYEALTDEKPEGDRFDQLISK